jgi:dTMP kinase
VARHGRFIVLEGGEGSGKSTQARILAAGLDAVLTREPGGTRLGEAIRPLVLAHTAGPVDDRAELLLMVAARAQHCAEVILPAIEAGRDVVCDRFSGSTIAYQGFGRGLPVDEVAAACALATASLDPDLTILIDVPVEIAMERRSRPLDAIESAGVDFHERVRQGFFTLAERDARWVIVDGRASIDEVAEKIRAAVEGWSAAFAVRLRVP